ncbi:helicase-exonuclease AddAB subunit AddB [Anoxynatronum sibiricum]|uniref:Helicase-exonuclease AddAB subunit AddB n=1 Tax=Anoxynatronum sibiricum TaxID=210623 RepID=A0ABU9VPY4_9CLOT
MLHLLVGQQVEEKAHWMYRQIQQMVDDDEMHRIIVPEQFTVQAERAYLEITGSQGLMNPEVISFNRLAYRVFQETGGRTRVVIDDLGKHMLLRKCLMDLEPQLTLYRGLVRERGLVDKMVESLTECKQYEITPEMLSGIAKKVENQPLLADKLHDLAMVYHYFEEALMGKYLDREDQFAALIQQMESSETVGKSHFWIDGFFSFTPRMLTVIQQLSRKAKNVYLTVYGNTEWIGQSGEPLMHQINEFLQRVKQEMPVQVVDVDVLLEKTEKLTALTHVQNTFQQLPVKPWMDETRQVHFFAATSDDSEVDEVAARIRQLVQEENYRYREIAVLCADLDNRQGSIKRGFELQEIPFFLDVRRKQLEHPLIRLIPAALDVISKGYTLQSVFTYMKTGYADISQNDLEALENAALAQGLRGSRWKYPVERWEEEPGGDRLNQLRQQVIEPLINLEEALKNGSDVKNMTRGVFQWLKVLDVPRQIEAEAAELQENQDPETAALITQLWNRMIQLMDQLVELMGETTISLREYRQLWQAGLENIEIGLIPPKNDQVMVGTPERSRQAGIRVLFLMGVNDGVLPAVPGNTGVLLETEKAVLQQQGCPLGVESEVRQAHEILTIHLALARPSDLLWVSYSLAGVEGEAKRPSILVDRLRKMFPKVPLNSNLTATAASDLGRLWSSRYSYLALAGKMRELADEKVVPSFWKDLFYWFRQHPDWQAAADQLAEALFYRNQPPALKQNQAQALFGNEYRGTVSRLELFNRCPFAHFVRYGLKPSPRKQREILAPDMGTLLHEMMDTFGRHLQKAGLDPRSLEENTVRQLTETMADQLVDDFQYGVFNSSARFQYQGHRLKRVSRRAVDTMLHHLRQTGFQPFAYEIRFGGVEGDGALTSFQISTGDGTRISLEGRIDRLDHLVTEEATYYRVIDYKSGKQTFSLTELMYGLQLQLLVYLMAALKQHEGTENEPSKPAGMFYFYLDDPLVNMNADDEAAAREEIRKQLKMNGLVLENLEIIREMDHSMEQDSMLIPAGITKAGELKKSSSTISEDDLGMLQRYVCRQIGETATAILQGEIQASPARLKNWKACHYCEYQSICQYDEQFEDNQPRKFMAMKDSEALQKMRECLMPEKEETHESVDQ